jgi:hypothetical protein
VEDPIACSFDGVDVRGHVDEWKAIFAVAVVGTEWSTASSVRMRLSGSSEWVGALVDLAMREAACCPFFRFGVEITAGEMVFTASVPTEAIPVLRGFASLALQ